MLAAAPRNRGDTPPVRLCIDRPWTSRPSNRGMNQAYTPGVANKMLTPQERG